MFFSNFYRYFFYSKADMMFYFFIIMPIFLVSIVVSLKLNLTYKKYSNLFSKKNISGAVIARNILDSYNLQHIRVEMVEGNLTDHYDPRENVVRLSRGNYESSSIASIGVAAHEVGHAIQYSKEYFPIKVRALAIPATKFGTILSMPIFFAGLIFANYKLAGIGILLFSFVAIFQFITLPVEFNASARAIKILEGQNILDSEEIIGVKKVLWAAAMTYVVAFLSSLAQVFRLILILSSRRDDDWILDLI